MIEDIKNLTPLISWQITTMIIVLILRKNFVLFLQAITDKVKRPGEFTVTRNGFSISEYIDKEIEKGKNEVISTLYNSEKKIIFSGSELQKSSFKTKIDEKPPHNIDPNSDPIKFSPDWINVPGPVANKRKIEAKVSELGGGKYFKIKITVSSTDPTDPLVGKVKFYLHPTFVNANPEVTVIDGKAVLNLVTYGSFTFGVVTDNGTRKVKMDLAEDVVGVSDYFKFN